MCRELNSYKQDLTITVRYLGYSSKYQLYFWALNRTLFLFPVKSFMREGQLSQDALPSKMLTFSGDVLAHGILMKLP